jgi:S-disulfanyl-L-cysteine oxidoreductase SoxD
VAYRQKNDFRFSMDDRLSRQVKGDGYANERTGGTLALQGCMLALLIGTPLVSSADDGPAIKKAGWFTREQAIRGRGSFQAKCAACHAENMAGIGPAPPLAGGAFLAKWSAATVFDLFDRVSTTMPQNAPHSLSDSDCIDVVAFILRANNFPTGNAELAADPKALRDMPLTAGAP